MSATPQPLNNCMTCVHLEDCHVSDPRFCHSWEPDEAKRAKILAAARVMFGGAK